MPRSGRSAPEAGYRAGEAHTASSRTQVGPQGDRKEAREPEGRGATAARPGHPWGGRRVTGSPFQS